MYFLPSLYAIGLSALIYIILALKHKSIIEEMARTPVYFLSHGGPNLIYEVNHPAYAQLQKVGKEITSLSPAGVVVLSAHWQEKFESMVNTAEDEPLIYDFYGFPRHYYQEKYPHRGSVDLSQKVLGMLEKEGLRKEGVARGLDHGVWICFKIAFHPESNPLKVPIVQVSIPSSNNPQDYHRLGQALSPLRDQNIVIITTGMAVHNLRDFRFGAAGMSSPLPYTVSFDEALKNAVEEDVEKREKSMAAILQRPDCKKAHPTLEHLFPLYVGAGAAGEDRGKRLWTLPEGSMSWAQYRFGDAKAG